MKKTYITALALSGFAFSHVAYAQTLTNNLTSLANIIQFIYDLASIAIPLFIALAVAYFVFGVFKYVMNAGDEEKRKEGKSAMLYGIIAIFVMVSVWGLVNILRSSTNLDTTQAPAPTIPVLP